MIANLMPRMQATALANISKNMCSDGVARFSSASTSWINMIHVLEDKGEIKILSLETSRFNINQFSVTVSF